MTKVEIDPGRCGHVAAIRDLMGNMGFCADQLISECRQIPLLAGRIAAVSPEEAGNPGSGRILAQVRCGHPAFCSVFCALMRAAEMESGPALSGDVRMHLEHTGTGTFP